MEMKDLEELKKQLLSRIDETDLLEIKKVNNLIRLYELDAKCDKVIDRDGVSITVKNGKQEFTKSHPSMNEKMKINTQIIALEKSIKFKLKIDAPTSTSTVESKDKRADLI